MKKTEKKEEKNPLHKDYGALSNARYIIKAMVRHNRWFLVLIPLGIICAPTMQYLWTFISKFVIDMITGEAGVEALLWLMVMFTALQMVSTMLNTYYFSEIWWRYIATRFKMLSEKNAKVMNLDFGHLENSDVLDCYQKAGNACGSNDSGVEGMMRELVNLLMTAAVVAVGLAILGSMNIYIVLLMLVLCIINFLINNHTNKKAKKQIWDPLSTWWRKDNYMRDITTSFDSAKDIRMFGLKDWLTEKLKELKKGTKSVIF